MQYTLIMKVDFQLSKVCKLVQDVFSLKLGKRMRDAQYKILSVQF